MWSPRKSGVGVILAFALLALWPVSHPPVVGAARVIDGDTLEIAGDRYRLYGLDAPERGQLCRMPDGRNWPCGQEAGAALDRFIAARPVACTVRDRDSYGRWVAICRVDGADIGGWMVRGGWAVADHSIADGYTGAEGAARFLRFGLWAGAFDPPSEWRRTHP